MATASLLAAVACGGGDGPTGTGGGGGGGGGGSAVTQITLTPGPQSITVGQTVTFTAQPKDAAGTAVSGQTVTWSSSNTGIATVSGGTVTGVSAGSATITAAVGSVTSTVAVTVAAAGPAPVASVTITPDSTAVATGASRQLAAVVKDAAGQTLTGRTVTWSSSDNTKATVNASGIVTGVAVGTVTITASSEGKLGTAKLVVLDDHAAPTISSLTVTPTSVNVGSAAQTVTITARVQDVGSGIAFFYVKGTSPTGPFNECSVTAPTSGTINDGTYTCTLTIARGASNGDWKLDPVVAVDIAGNQRILGQTELAAASFPTKFTVVSPTPDQTPPVLSSLTVTPTTVDVRTAAQNVTATVRITDANSGVVRFDFGLRSPAGVLYACASTAPTSGTVNDGTWSCVATIPAGAPSGDYAVVVKATDGATYFQMHDPVAGYPAGFPTKVTVTGK